MYNQVSQVIQHLENCTEYDIDQVQLTFKQMIADVVD